MRKQSNFVMDGKKSWDIQKQQASLVSVRFQHKNFIINHCVLQNKRSDLHVLRSNAIILGKKYALQILPDRFHSDPKTHTV